MSASDQHDGLGGEQPFISHLVELRDRLMRAVIAILLVFLVLFPFANDIYSYVAAPLQNVLPEGSSMIATQVASPFLTPFKLALFASVFLTMPFLLYQAWGFVAPGLYQHEKRLATPLLISSILLFYLGMLFAYYVVFPLVFAFLTSMAPDGVEVATDITHYLDFVITLFFAFGVAFEIPIATILLVAIGATTPESLAHKRPYVIVGVFVLGMLLTPPDMISQTLLAIPMWLLFEAGIIASRLLLADRAKRAAESVDESADPEDPEPAPAGAASARAGHGSSVHSADEAVTAAGARMNAVHGGKGGDEVVVGRDLDPAFYDEDRFRPMTDDEMEAELDAIEAEELADLEPHRGGSDAQGVGEDDEDSGLSAEGIDPVDAKIVDANACRDRGDLAATRRLLYEVLEVGDEDQRRVARNILAELDRPD